MAKATTEVRKITAHEHALVETIRILGTQSNFSRFDLSLDQEKNPVSVWSDEATERDALGWLLKQAFESPQVREAGVEYMKRMAHRISEDLNKKVRRIAPGRSLVSINEDEGYEATLEILKKVLKSVKRKKRR